jgi:uncharacterized protein YbjT (DUF2867 family)
MMRIAVIGGTGQVGRHTVVAVRQAGHDAVSISRSIGVDVLSGDGLDDALAGADAVIDATNTAEMDADATRRFFGTISANLVAAEQRAGVGHHVLLSIVGVDRIDSNPHYVGKLQQEEVLREGTVSWTILRATQFFDFPAMVVGWTTNDGVATVPPLLMQPVAIRDVAHVLAELAAAPPANDIIEFGGPKAEDLVDLARRTLAARNDSTELAPAWSEGMFGVEMAGNALLPKASARRARTTFDEWLKSETAGPDAPA